jgi:hypothetical protein
MQLTGACEDECRVDDHARGPVRQASSCCTLCKRVSSGGAHCTHSTQMAASHRHTSLHSRHETLPNLLLRSTVGDDTNSAPPACQSGPTPCGRVARWVAAAWAATDVATLPCALWRGRDKRREGERERGREGERERGREGWLSPTVLSPPGWSIGHSTPGQSAAVITTSCCGGRPQLRCGSH